MDKLKRLYGIALIAVLWEATSRSEVLPSQFFPPLSVVLLSFVQLVRSGEFLEAEALTVSRALVGFAVAALIGVCLAVVTSMSRTVDAMLSPIIEFLRPIPPAAMIPIAIFFLGIGKGLFLFTIAFASTWPIYISASNALRSVDRVLMDTGRSFGCEGWQQLFLIRLPYAAPEIFTGFRLGMGIALLATVVVEMLTGRGGVGFLLYDSAFSLRIPEMFAAMILAGLNGFFFNWIFGVLRTSFTGWHINLSQQQAGQPAS